jgi:hypothetical protein
MNVRREAIRRFWTQRALLSDAVIPNQLLIVPDVKQYEVGREIEKLRVECDITVEFLAEEIGIEPRSVYRHLSGDATPNKRRIAIYEKVFSERLNRPVTLRNS